MTEIIDVIGREILDSRGNPTVEVDIKLKDGSFGRAAVPSGASTGRHEAVERRDHDKNRYNGMGVRAAVHSINHEIRDLLIGRESMHQTALDRDLCNLDGTENKQNLGANAILGASLAIAHAAAHAVGLPLFRYVGGVHAHILPTPMMNIINGGAHADNAIDFQEFMIIPAKATSFAEAVRLGAEVFQALRKILSADGLGINVGDEGGFAPALTSTEAALDYISRAVEATKLQLGDDIVLALDAASSEFYKQNMYDMVGANKRYDAAAMVAYYEQLTTRFPIVSIEDGMAEDDWEGWQALTQALGDRVQLVGDDLFVTNPKRLANGIATQSGNAVLVKVNQIGTLSEALECMRSAHQAGFKTIMSHRSGETEDTTIADLSVATNCGQIKTGSVSRSDRVAKYNQLLRIEEQLGTAASYYGW